MTPTERERFLTALGYAKAHARERAAAIRAAIPEDDGDPEARRCTPQGWTEDDAAEWELDAELIERLIRETL